ncbi:Cytochrome c-type biogenesis protein CcmH precursor [Pseudovibrio axinellae]|uniref:Cytochrome c-type biogenesis protein n=1 Tax=Pseudovibrio axinellae TaxID=989403 RepID=A0A166AFC5_9HYPH|nr:cytochrome c-type biogenesis protein [Pseudovibrio axinellae]KZL20995.1 Cytochrome c-type biogenesis protein CcmH precursor [Pseudovibrio axinellae]SEP79720.1 cytochrome c-type biogenesis protein CcmH [Pseudovibrio axinellae]
MKMKFVLVVMSSIFLGTPAAFAVNPDEVLKDPVLEERAREISKEVRCVVCQNQSIDDSNAQLAKDLRLLVRERLVEGDSDAEVMDYLVARYGEFVLLKPRFALHTLFLWGGGPIVLLLGGFFLWRSSRKKKDAPLKSAAGIKPLSAEEKAALDKLMSSE